MTDNADVKIGGLLLAAGGSSRLGQPKQLVEFDGKTLIRRSVETLISSICDPIVVVLGAEIERSAAEIADMDLRVVINEDWRTGMSSSIKSGLQELLHIEPNLAAVIITLCDQPQVTSSDLNQLASKFKITNSPIVAAEYNSTTGVPALFASEVFDDLFGLTGDKGARQIIRNRREEVIEVEMLVAATDIDTVEDFKELTNAFEIE